jgi:putative IMPACT (imprinted ancient) family translation regulator
LIQAYSECAKQTLAHAPIREAEIVKQLHFAYDFDLTQMIRNIVNKYQAKIIEETYDDEAIITLEINQGYLVEFKKELNDITKGKIHIT